jgi:hypothetical protein
MEPGQRFRLAQEVVLQDFTGKALLVDLHAERVYQLNESGARVARLLVEGQSLGELLAVLDGEFQAGPGELERDVRLLLAELLEQGLIERL